MLGLTLTTVICNAGAKLRPVQRALCTSRISHPLKGVGSVLCSSSAFLLS